jgi:8-oxo-dGTP pyrophosphatase MutT (NUDIX family)
MLCGSTLNKKKTLKFRTDMKAKKNEHSAGAVVCDSLDVRAKIIIYLRNKATQWCLPKGKIESGEKPVDTALREVLEETGVRAKPVKYIEDIYYQYNRQDKQIVINKTVSFFLMQKLSQDQKPSDPEVEEIQWLPISQAVGRLSFESEREIVKKAQKMIEQGIS